MKTIAGDELRELCKLLGFDWLEKPAPVELAKRAHPDPDFGLTLGTMIPTLLGPQTISRPLVFPNSPEALAVVARSVARSSAMRWN